MYKSQIGQDKWVQSVLGDISNGFFVELGACDGIEYSNTYFFEKTLGWKGICIEPNPMYHGQLSYNRGCSISHYCASDKDDEQIDFAISGVGSGVVATAGPFTNTSRVLKIPTKTMKSILAMNGAPAVIDYLSLDVEGHEYEIMKNFPFNEYRFRCITVEHNEPHTGPAMRQTMRALLEGNDYIFIKGNDDVQGWGHGPIDDFYIHKSVQSQSIPV